MMNLKKIPIVYYLYILLFLILALRLFTLDMYPLTDTTEARYAEISRKMLETGNYITPFFDYNIPFWGKPPFSFWVSAVSMSLAGVSAFGARLGVYLVGLLTLSLFFFWSGKLAIHSTVQQKSDSKVQQKSDSNLGVMASIIFLSTPLGFVVTGAVMTDLSLVLGTTLSMVAFHQALQGQKLWSWLFFIGLSIGLLSKGPLALVMVGLPIGLYTLVYRNFKQVWQALPWGLGTLLMLGLSLPWYVLAELRTPGFLEYFIVGEHWSRFTITDWSGDLYGSAHPHAKGMIWVYAVIITLPWCLITPAVVYFVRPGWKPSPTTVYLSCWILSPLLFFTLAGNILPAYVLPGLPAFCLLAANYIHKLHLVYPKSYNLWYIPTAIMLIATLALPIPVVLLKERSQQHLLMRYDPQTTLIYFDRQVASAQFYSGGKATIVKTKKELQPWLDQTKPTTLVLNVRELIKKGIQIPATWRQLTQHGDWVMLTNVPPQSGLNK